LTRREERKLRVFENMVLRRMFGPRRDEETLMQKWGERIFSSQQLDRRVSIRIVMIMELD